ncbi:hypothetical protein EDB83DRAFT_2315683 [Lactarius deliciosus]|nr:hypothetical protein EDB83DRAFT_2315683 [Lactarius deliciosus]
MSPLSACPIGRMGGAPRRVAAHRTAPLCPPSASSLGLPLFPPHPPLFLPNRIHERGLGRRLRPRLRLRGNGKRSFDPSSLFLRKGGTGAGTAGPHLPLAPLPSLLRAALHPFTQRGRGKGTTRDQTPPLRPRLSLRANGEPHGKGYALPPSFVLGRTMPAAPRPLPFPSAPPCPRGRGAHEGMPRRLRPSLPVSARPRTKRERTRARCPGPSPFGRAPSTRGKGARDARPAPLLLWPRRPVRAERENARRDSQPLPSPFARKGGARGHAAPLRPRSLPFLHGRAVLDARKGARVGAPPSALSFPVRAEGAHEGTLPDDPPWPPPGGAGKVSPPAPVCANGGTAREPPSRRLPPFSRKGGTGAPPTPVRRSDARTDGGVEWKGARRAGAAHKSRGSTRLGGAPPRPFPYGGVNEGQGGTRNSTRAPRLPGGSP